MAGLHHGALLRYLQAAIEFAPLRPGAKPADSAPLRPGATPADAAAVAAELKALEGRLATGGVDHSLGQIFLEMAQADLEEDPPQAGAARAAAVATDILPRYLAALEPAQARTPRPEARVTITLVRWPYT